MTTYHEVLCAMVAYGGDVCTCIDNNKEAHMGIEGIDNLTGNEPSTPTERPTDEAIKADQVDQVQTEHEKRNERLGKGGTIQDRRDREIAAKEAELEELRNR